LQLRQTLGRAAQGLRQLTICVEVVCQLIYIVGFLRLYLGRSPWQHRLARTQCAIHPSKAWSNNAPNRAGPCNSPPKQLPWHRVADNGFNAPKPWRLAASPPTQSNAAWLPLCF
jgi:hypothetical protein